MGIFSLSASSLGQKTKAGNKKSEKGKKSKKALLLSLPSLPLLLPGLHK